VDPAVHVSVSREPRRPLHTIIKEAMPVISHSRVGRVVKRCQRPGRAASGPTIRLVPSESVHSCRGWRDNSRKHIVSNDAILWASWHFFDSEGEAGNGSFEHQRYAFFAVR
jgi:hypothetical protein